MAFVDRPPLIAGEPVFWPPIPQELKDDDIVWAKGLKAEMERVGIDLAACPTCDCSPLDEDDDCDCECHD